MFESIPVNLRKIFRKILRSIAFFPALITLGYIVLALVLLSAENQGMSAWVKERFPLFIIQDAETGRAILTTLIGATISLTVFSFSMVMVVLNQASSNYSPRLLPRLVSNKRHQIVLGTYIGSICFHLIVLLSILPDAEQWQIPGFTVFTAVLIGILCVGLFVYFIHGISESIQIDRIIHGIYTRTKERIAFDKKLRQNKRTAPLPDTKNWEKVPSRQAGYLISVDFASLAALCRERQGSMRLLLPFGAFVLPNVPFASCSWSMSAEDKDRLFDNCELIQDTPNDLGEVGFKRMTEVAVKAMSPGINDPGTAISAIDFLSSMLAERLQVPEHNCYEGEDGGVVFYHRLHFSSIISAIMESLRLYCKHDILVVRKLLSMLHFLFLQYDRTNKEQEDSILRELRALLEDAHHNIKNSIDREVIAHAVQEINKDIPKMKQLHWQTQKSFS